jgi:hypothetical protein
MAGGNQEIQPKEFLAICPNLETKWPQTHRVLAKPRGDILADFVSLPISPTKQNLRSTVGQNFGISQEKWPQTAAEAAINSPHTVNR